MTDLMTIGEFASATWLSPKALRLYDRNGLLSPDTIDPSNGYRKYSHAQIEVARLVAMLRRIEMPLDQIRVLLGLAEDERASFVARYREAEAERHSRRQSLARFVEHAVAQGSLDGSGQPGASRFEVSLRTVPKCAVLTSTRHTSARDLPDVIRFSAAKLFQLAEARGGARGGPVVIYHGQVGWESDGPVEICVPLHDATRAHRVESEHLQLFTQVSSEDVQFPRILTAFEAVQTRARELGLSPAGPPREIYTPENRDSVPRCEVALPVTTDES
jgi:DNA-binding transcriptional MerR regulator